MSVAIQITLTPEAEALIKRVAAFPAALPAALARDMDYQNELTVDHIRQKYLSFGKGGPSTLEGLRVQTNDYRRSLRAAKSKVDGSGLTSSIGSNVKNKGFSYPALHEFGGVVHHPARAGRVRLRTNAKGELLLQPGRRGAWFASKSHKRTKTVEYQGKAYTVTFPARAPIQRGIADRLPDYRRALSATVLQLLKGGAN